MYSADDPFEPKKYRVEISTILRPAWLGIFPKAQKTLCIIIIANHRDLWNYQQNDEMNKAQKLLSKQLKMIRGKIRKLYSWRAYWQIEFMFKTEHEDNEIKKYAPYWEYDSKGNLIEEK